MWFAYPGRSAEMGSRRRSRATWWAVTEQDFNHAGQTQTDDDAHPAEQDAARRSEHRP